MKYIVTSLFLLYSLLCSSQNSIDSTNQNLVIDSLMKKADELVGSEDYERAIIELTNARKIVTQELPEGNLKQVEVLNKMGEVYNLSGNIDSAEMYYLQVVDFVNNYHKELKEYERSLLQLAKFYYQLQNFQEAEKYLIEANNSCHSKNWQDSLINAEILDNLTKVYLITRNFVEAETTGINTIQTKEKLFDKQDKEYLKSLFRLSQAYLNQWKFENTLEVLRKLFSIYSKSNLDFDDLYIMSLNNLAIVHYYSDNFQEAIKTMEFADSICKKSFDIGNESCTNILLLQGTIYSSVEEYRMAIKAFEEILSIEKNDKSNSSYYLNSLVNLAIIYSEIGDYINAEEKFIEVLDIKKEKSDTLDHTYFMAKINLAFMYRYLENSQKSLSELLLIKNQIDKYKTQYWDLYSGLLNNMSVIEGDLKNYENSINYLKEGLQIIEDKYGMNSFNYAGILSQLASSHRNLNNLDTADSLYQESFKITNETVGLNNRQNAWTLFGLGQIQLKKYNFLLARDYFNQSRKIFQEIFGTNHPSFIKANHNYCLSKFFAYDLDSIYESFTEHDSLQKNLLIQSSKFLAEKELFELYDYLSYNSGIIYLLFSQKDKSVGIEAALGYDNSIFYKGLVYNSFSRLKRLAKSDSITYKKLEDLTYLNKKLAEEYSRPSQNSLLELEAEVTKLEKELARNVSAFDKILSVKNWNDIQAVLNKNEIAIEFVKYPTLDSSLSTWNVYGANILKNDSDPVFVELCDESEIEYLVESFGTCNFRNINKLYTNNNIGSELYQKIWKPLLPYLKDVETIYFSPSGILHRINISALPISDKEVIGDKWTVKTLNSTYYLAEKEESDTFNQNQKALVLGDIKYELEDNEKVLENDILAQTDLSRSILEFNLDSMSRANPWVEIPESKVEINRIHEFLTNNSFNVELTTNVQAKEEIFQQYQNLESNSPQIIHFATHGFFLPENITSTRKSFLEGERVFGLSDHPMMRSGLLLAGANHKWQTGENNPGREDGILTSYEISNLNLSNTELVVLSACETGLGEIRGNEGVYGLQRAFKIAGVRYVLMSLWKVNDKATREFMVEFYRQWLDEEQEIPEAYRLAQSYMRHLYPESPYLWAAFVLIE